TIRGRHPARSAGRGNDPGRRAADRAAARRWLRISARGGRGIGVNGTGTPPSSSREAGLLTAHRGRVDDALREVARRSVDGLRPDLRVPLEYALSTTGKRIRPTLCVLAYRAAARAAVDLPASVYR